MENYKIFAKTIEKEALKQIEEMSKSEIGKDAHIRIMPDCHSGKSCVIGTTMKVTNKVCPNVVGVDIGCGVMLIRFDYEFENHLEELDEIIRKKIPHGYNIHEFVKLYDFSKLKCWENLLEKTHSKALHSLGTLGGGNHFIEAYKNGYIAVHTGSRNIGLEVAKYYQRLAEHKGKPLTKEEIQKVDPLKREEFIRKWKEVNKVGKGFEYIEDEIMQDYLHDIEIMQDFAYQNRLEILKTIQKELNIENLLTFTDSVHNYIDTKSMILRKGATCADKNKKLVIPLNMRDGLLLCNGKGNEDWNNSAPHGAGRLYSRTRAKQEINIEDFEKSMEGIYTSCVNYDTIDESPFAYKDYKEIMYCIEPTVEIIERLIPIYNFKAN